MSPRLIQICFFPADFFKLCNVFECSCAQLQKVFCVHNAKHKCVPHNVTFSLHSPLCNSIWNWECRNGDSFLFCWPQHSDLTIKTTTTPKIPHFQGLHELPGAKTSRHMWNFPLFTNQLEATSKGCGILQGYWYWVTLPKFSLYFLKHKLQRQVGRAIKQLQFHKNPENTQPQKLLKIAGTAHKSWFFWWGGVHGQTTRRRDQHDSPVASPTCVCYVVQWVWIHVYNEKTRALPKNHDF